MTVWSAKSIPSIKEGKAVEGEISINFKVIKNFETIFLKNQYELNV